MAERLVADIFDALDEQTVVVPGTNAAALIVPSLAASLTAVLDQRRLLAARIEELLEAHPLSQVLTSMPGIGVRTAARILIDVGDGSAFATAGHLASYAGLAPATRRSGSSIRGEHPARRGNKQLKRAFYLAAFASLSQARLPGLLRQETTKGETPRRRDCLPGPTPHRRPLRHAPRRHLLRTVRDQHRLTKAIGALFGPDVGGVEDDAGDVDQAGVVEPVQHGLVQTAPDTGSGPDQEPAVRSRLRYPEARRQSPPGATADEHVDDRREQRLIRYVLRSATLRSHSGPTLVTALRMRSPATTANSSWS
ncbi:hypothetical protein RKD38_002272 [Streptomyces ambofaciens]